MSDACCGPRDDAELDAGPEKLWQVRELQFAVLAAVLLSVGWIVGRFGGYEGVVEAVELAAVAAGAITFVPDAARNLRHGRIGVGTLMTIAAIGAVALGQFAEAALLGILFSIAEGWSTTPSAAPAAGFAPCCLLCRRKLGATARHRNNRGPRRTRRR